MTRNFLAEDQEVAIKHSKISLPLAVDKRKSWRDAIERYAIHTVTKIGRTSTSHGKSRWGFGQVKWCPWSLKGRKCCEVAHLSRSKKRSSRWLQPASSEICSRETLTMVFMGKKWKLSWSLKKGAEGHIRGQMWISLPGSGAGQRPVAQSQYLDAVPGVLQVRWYQFKKLKEIKEAPLTVSQEGDGR